MSSSPSSANRSLSLFRSILLVLLIATMLANAANTRRQRHHHQKQKKAEDDDYEYRDVTDYSSGVFVDSVPISSTKKSSEQQQQEHSRGTTLSDVQSREYQKTNRYPKLRKFYDSEDERRWYEAIFAQRRK